ncbi:MAG: choice-of-anchor B family protein [Lewinellaceae bacterium]|nr:choice-of-anchor B family protein [Lewinellaceae bacterium]
MRIIPVIAFCICTATSFTQNINVTFRSVLSYQGQNLANVWGYSDASGNEYALVGAKQGMSIVDVTNPDNPTEIVQIPGAFSNWHEIKTFQHYAYVVSEGGSGVQVVDLSNLPGSNLTYHSYFGDGAINGQLTKAHALHVDLTKGYLYVYGSNINGGRALIFNLNNDPYNPQYAGTFNSGFSALGNYIHDGYVDNDIMYSAHIYSGFFSIVNVANKSNPSLLAVQNTPGSFTHNTWHSGSALFTTDEVSGSFLTSYDVSNPGNVNQLDKIQSNPGTFSTVHNTHIINDYAVTSWYRDGFTIVDVSRPANMVQVGNYDTYPNAGGSGFQGCWGVYPYLPSGNILASNINAEGTANGTGELWILTPTYERGCYLEGLITDVQTGFPINGATVKILGSNTTENSAANGEYKMGQLQGGNFDVLVTKTGYIPYSTSVSLSNGVLTTLNAALLPVGLPVTLTRFSATAEGKDALLRWSTAAEIDNDGFEVEHSRTNTSGWETAGFVKGTGTPYLPADYSFRVHDLAPGTHYFRLRQKDLNGSSTYSQVKSVEIGGARLQAAFRPNVVNDRGELFLACEKSISAKVSIFTIAGTPAGLSWNLDLEGEASFPLDLSNLPKGMYYALVTSEQEHLILPFFKG